MPRIAAILTYPVAGCRANRVKGCGLSARGLDGDRRWKVISEDGTTLAEDPILAKVWVEQKGAELWLVAAGMDRLLLADPAGAGAWFSRLLARPVTCAHLADDEASGPLLATTTSSLARLNQALPSSVPVERFRPNFVLEGTDPFDEDGWSAVKVAGVRCVVTPFIHSGRGQFGILLAPALTGAASVALRPGQGLDVELS